LNFILPKFRAIPNSHNALALNNKLASVKVFLLMLLIAQAAYLIGPYVGHFGQRSPGRFKRGAAALESLLPGGKKGIPCG
jgi:hypothetical protein